MDVDVERIDEETAYVSITGKVDMHDPAQLEEVLSGLVIAGVTKLVVDLSEVSFLNSKLLDTLVRISGRIDPRQGGIAVLTSQTYVRHMLEITEDGGVLLLETGKDEALAALAGASA